MFLLLLLNLGVTTVAIGEGGAMLVGVPNLSKKRDILLVALLSSVVGLSCVRDNFFEFGMLFEA